VSGCVVVCLNSSEDFSVAGDVGNENDQRLMGRNLRPIPIVDGLNLH
jgi:hypothetical protein